MGACASSLKAQPLQDAQASKAPQQRQISPNEVGKPPAPADSSTEQQNGKYATIQESPAADGVTQPAQQEFAASDFKRDAVQSTPGGRGASLDKAMVEDSLTQALGLPYCVFERGPYEPPCQEARLAYSQSLGLLDSPPPDPQVAHILTALAQIFDTDSVLLTLCGQQRVWIRNAVGFSAGDFPWRWAFCGWSLAPPTPQVLVVEDTLQDARFRDNLVVQGEPHIRFFVGAPLVASNGHRLGTLCYLGPRPRTITAGQAMILANMAELVVRELEKDAVSSAQKQRRASGEQLDMYMMRSVACFSDQAVAFVDTQPQLWQAVHCNIALSNITGIAYDSALSQPFWDLIEPPFEPGSEAWTAAEQVVARAGEFVVRGCTVRKNPAMGFFTLTFRPADRTALDADTLLVGVPPEVPSALEGSGRYYFVLFQPSDADAEQLPAGGPFSDGSVLGGLRSAVNQTPIPGLELGTLLGKGSFGRVFRGMYKGRQVAVKVCSSALSQARGKRNKPWAGVEAVASKQLDHPCVVRTFKHTAVLVKEGQVVSQRNDSLEAESSSRSSGAASWNDGTGWYEDEQAAWDADPSWGPAPGPEPPAQKVEMELWSVLEYCNKGTLQAGVDKGHFREQRTSRPPSSANIPVVLATAAQLASGMAYLHSKDITHGDLCGGNVLLTSDETQPHGFFCKVADFGLSRSLQSSDKIMQTATYGTVTHMPPELLMSGRLSKACDVYAFGILLWEMLNGARAWANMSHTQILSAVGMDKRSLTWPSNSHPGLRDLANECMSRDSAKRPTFTQIEERLAQLQREAGVAAAPTLVS